MKPLTLFAAIFMCAATTFVNAQEEDPGPGTVTVYSEDGENFTLYLNGDKKNANPAARVVANNISEVPVSFRIVYADGAVPEVKRNGMRQGTNCLYSIEKNKKGERVLKMKGCSNDAVSSASEDVAVTTEEAATSTTVATTTPDQLSATYANGVITINDGRTLTVKKVKANGMTYPRLMFTALQGAKVSIAYDANSETYSAESPLEYEVKDFSNNNAYFTMTVDEGGPKKTWKVKLQNSNGYDLKIE